MILCNKFFYLVSFSLFASLHSVRPEHLVQAISKLIHVSNV